MPQKPPGRPGCRKSLWQGRHEGKPAGKARDAAKAFGKGATRDLEAG